MTRTNCDKRRIATSDVPSKDASASRLIEHEDGTKHWYLNGQLHREDGPAIEWADGTKAWFLNAQLHREDGPAIEQPDGTKEWYLNGEPMPTALRVFWELQRKNQ